MNFTRQELLAVLLFGSIWGGLEAVVCAAMGGGEGPISRSVILAFISSLVVVYARLAFPHRWFILAIGLVAVGFKFLGLPNLYACQLAGVIGQAIVLEATFAIADWRSKSAGFGWLAPLVLLSGYVNAFLFCMSQAYLFGNHWWADRGFGGNLSWVVTNGSLAAIAGVLGLGIAWLLHRNRAAAFSRFVNLRPTVYNGAVIVVSTCFWTMGAILARQ
jgi:hypothetical protein